jgi:hypothetical protein
MSSPALDGLLRDLRQLDFTLRRMEALYSKEKIVLRDLYTVYESLFMRAVTSFEFFLQEQFLSILRGRAKYEKARGVIIRMSASSDDALMDILHQGRAYVTWMPYADTKKRALIYLKDGRPFSDIQGNDFNTLNNIGLIRNAIAHRSTHATREFENKVIGTLPLLRAERKPAGFLRSQLRAGKSRFEFYVYELGRVGSGLC